MTRIRLLAPTGGELIKSENEVDLREHRLRRVRMNLAGMPYTENGRYRFLVELGVGGDKWETVANIPVQIDIKMVAVGTEQAPTAPAP